jgi:hypothetical protein
MYADYGRKSYASVENPYTIIAPKINHGCRKYLIGAWSIEDGLMPGAWPALRPVGGHGSAPLQRAQRAKRSIA